MVFTVGETVEEAIFDNIISTLTAIAPPTYNTTVQAVRDMRGDIVEVDELPAAIVFHGGTRMTDPRPSCVQKILTAYVVCGVNANSDDPRQDAQRFLADVEAALASTYTRGGDARSTAIVDYELLPRTREDAVQQLTITVEVVFAHLFADPTTSI